MKLIFLPLHHQKVNRLFRLVVIPQFRSIIPCEVLLYIEVTFLDLSIDMGIFWGSWFLHSHEIPHPNQWGSMKNHKNDVYSRKTSE